MEDDKLNKEWHGIGLCLDDYTIHIYSHLFTIFFDIFYAYPYRSHVRYVSWWTPYIWRRLAPGRWSRSALWAGAFQLASWGPWWSLLVMCSAHHATFGKTSWNLHETFMKHLCWNLLWTFHDELSCIVNYACCCNTIWFLWSVGSNFWQEDLSLRILSTLELEISLLPKAWELQNHLPTCWSKWRGRFGGNQGLVAASHSDQPASHCANSRVPEIHGGFLLDIFWRGISEKNIKKWG